MRREKPKVLIIFPESDDSITHYPYWYALFNSVKAVDLHIHYESLQKIKLKPFNLLERMLLIVKYRLWGYKSVYIHYSYWSVLLSKIVALFLPMKIYYWNCEKYEHKPRDRFLDLSLKLCDVLVTGSKGIGEQYRKVFNLGHKPIKIVPNYVEPIKPATSSLKLVSKKIHILFVHHLSPRKGSEELPQIIEQTIKRIPNAHFHIIGNGPDKSYLKKELTTRNLQPATTLYGSLPLPQVARYFRACDYFIMPSRAEGFPRVILEAMINQIPFVATRVGNVTELVTDLQLPYLVIPRRPKQFAQILIKLIKAKNKRTLIVANYKKVKAEYNRKIALLAFESLFNEATRS